MELLSEKPVRILAQGLTDSKNEFKNIDFDLPFLEMKQLEQSVDTFQLEQEDYNSAEIFNQERRKQYGTVKSFFLKDISKVYFTKMFKLYKLNQIISVSEYLLKVLKLLEIVNNTLLHIEKDAKTVIKSSDIKDKKEKEFIRAKTVVGELFELFSKITLMIADLQTDENNIGLESIINDMKEYIRLPLSTHYVPDELVPKISVVFPCLPLAKFSELDAACGRNVVSKAYEDFSRMEAKLYRIIFLFIDNMINQFSYYVTPEQFLNNPAGRTIFVIPMSMYKMFDFSNSGLYRREIIKHVEMSKHELNKKYKDFLSTVGNIFADIHDEANNMHEEIERIPDDFDAIKFLEKFSKKHPVERISKLKQFFQNPIVNERITSMLVTTRKNMFDAAKMGDNDPWFSEHEMTSEIKELDKDTVFFLLELYSIHSCGIKKFPQAEIWRVFNLFSYSKQIVKCMNWHVNNYEKGAYIVSGQYESKFAPLLIA